MGRLAVLLMLVGCGEVIRPGAPIDAAGDAEEDPPDGPPDARPDAPPVDPLVNGSFEQDYTGWTLVEDSGNPTNGVWGIAADGTSHPSGTVVHDFNDNIDHAPSCFGITPGLVDTLDGGRAAFNAQSGAERHLLSQIITFPAGLNTLSWSLAYENIGGFDLVGQFIALELRDPATEGVVATLFVTDPAAVPPPPMTEVMTQRQHDVSGFAGQTLKLTVHLQIQGNCLFTVVDDFKLR